MGAEQALIRAASKGQIDEVNRLLAIPAVQTTVTAIDNAALRLAAENGHLAVVERLLAIPAVVELATACGNEAFCWAARNGHLAVVERLLTIPAVIAKSNKALASTAESGHLTMVEHLLAIPAVQATAAANDNEALQRAAGNGHLAVVERLLTIPAVQTTAATNDNYALQMAAGNGHLAVVERLLAISAVQTLAAAYNNHALYLAAETGHLAVVERLLTIPAVRAAVAANDNEALRQAVARSSKYGRDPEKKQEYLSVLFRLLQAYKEENITIPSDIKIEGHKDLDSFFHFFINHFIEASAELRRYLIPSLISIINAYAPCNISLDNIHSVTSPACTLAFDKKRKIPVDLKIAKTSLPPVPAVVHKLIVTHREISTVLGTKDSKAIQGILTAQGIIVNKVPLLEAGSSSSEQSLSLIFPTHSQLQRFIVKLEAKANPSSCSIC